MAAADDDWSLRPTYERTARIMSSHAPAAHPSGIAVPPHPLADNPEVASSATPTLTLLAFAAALAVLIVGPPLLPGAFPLYPLLTIGEILDLLTPVILIPLGWLAFRAAAPDAPSTRQVLVFVGVAALLIEGQAMHLAANAIGHYVVAGDGDLARLTHDLDETLSHFIWHAGIIALAALIVWRARHAPAIPTSVRASLTIAGAAVLYGATYFLMVIEGGTAVLGLPAAVALGGIGAWVAGRRIIGRPGAAVFILGSIFAVALMIIWAAMNGWTLPQFSEVGLL
jgi:hypothetical protein